MLWGDNGINLSESLDFDVYSPSIVIDSKGNVYATMEGSLDYSREIVRLNSEGEDVLGLTYNTGGEVIDIKVNDKDQLIIGYYTDDTYFVDIIDSMFVSTLAAPIAQDSEP